MKECLLCKKNMNSSNNLFGKGCINNIYSFLDMDMPKKVKLREHTLQKNIMKTTNNCNINIYQKNFLTDRYLTLKYLDENPYFKDEHLKNKLKNDIEDVSKIKNNKKTESTKTISLKQAYDLYKKSIKFTEGIKKIKEGDLLDSESIKLIILGISFIFHIKKNSLQFEKNTFKAMQYIFWQTVIEIGEKYFDFDIAAYFLQHSLEKSPSDLLIKNGFIIDEIVKDNNFRNNIEKIINKYGKNKSSFIFNSDEDGNYPMTFKNSDLYFAINRAKIIVKGVKKGKNWILKVDIHDRYDYNSFKDIKDYYIDTDNVAKSIFSSTLYNCAYYSMKVKVMKEYDINIQFIINNHFEVINDE